MQGHGLKLVSKNFRCRFGEIDLIMRDRLQLVFVEVRYRVANHFADAVLSIGPGKQQKIIRTASMFIARNKRFASSVMRFDVVAIDKSNCGEPRIRWLRDAFRP